METIDKIQTGKYSIEKCREEIPTMAKKVIEMENSFDWSMRGVFIDQLVSEYVSQKGAALCGIYDFIYENQKENEDSYGDYDNNVVKLKITGELSDWKNYKDKWNLSATALFIIDNPTGSNENKWVIIKETRSYKDNPVNPFPNEQFFYYVIGVKKEIKTLNLKTIMKYGDMRDNGFIVAYETPLFSKNKSIRIKNRDSGLIYKYDRFKHLMDNLSIYSQLKEDVE